MSSDRRTHKKLVARKKIRHAILSPFAANGFDNVTIEWITGTADIPPMTFHQHFRTEEVVIVDIVLTGSVGQAVHRRTTLAPVAGTPEEIVGVIDSTLDGSADWIDGFTRRLRLVHGSPRLQDLL